MSPRPHHSRRVDCLGLGIMPLDILYEIASYPGRGAKIDAIDFSMHCGGPVPNSFVGLHRLGLTTALIAPIGDDVFGRIAVEQQRKEGVDCRLVVHKKGPSLVAVGLIEPDGGARTMVLNRKIHVKPSDLHLSGYPIPRLIHLDGRDLKTCLKLARWGRKAGAIISFDIGTIRNDVSAIFPLVDHLVVADSYALPYTGREKAKEAITDLQKLCPGTVVITEGINGQISCERGQFVRQRAFKVNSVDQTGAGDAFHAGYIFALLNGLTLADRLRYGSAVAALKCTKRGGRDGLPTLSQLNRFLKGNPSTYA